MNCIKCGREHNGDFVFCSKCLEVMKRYDVDKDAKLLLPQRASAQPKKATPRKKAIPPEELVVKQRKTIKWLCLALACSFLLLALSITLLFRFMEEDDVHVTIGQNYMTKDPNEDN